MYYYSQKKIKAARPATRLPVLRNLIMGSAIIITLTSCSGNMSSEEFINPSRASLSHKKSEAEQKRLTQAEKYFNEGKFGSAEQAYRLAIETNHKNADAWLGIAATYDNLRKFPNANRAYMIAIRLKGYTPEILNNLGYHYILRGDYPKARKALTAADKKEPGNQYIQNNLRLLEKYEQQGKIKEAKRNRY